MDKTDLLQNISSKLDNPPTCPGPFMGNLRRPILIKGIFVQLDIRRMSFLVKDKTFFKVAQTKDFSMKLIASSATCPSIYFFSGLVITTQGANTMRSTVRLATLWKQRFGKTRNATMDKIIKF